MQIIVGIATQSHRAKQLEGTIKSLEKQVDRIHLYNNSINSIDYTDNAKFYCLNKYKEPIYFFSCDDDLIYPSDYISRTIDQIELHKCIVSYHGRILKQLNVNYYRGHTKFSCLHNNFKDCLIDVCGTGVTAFRTDYFNPIGIYKSEHKRMSDLVFSLEAIKQNKKIMQLKHKQGWIKQQIVSSSIASTYVNNCKEQILLANQIIELK